MKELKRYNKNKLDEDLIKRKIRKKNPSYIRNNFFKLKNTKLI